MTIARGAGLSCDENHTRRSRSNQKTSGTGRAQGMRMLISSSGTLAGMRAISCGGVPYTVARSTAESANPVAGLVSAAIAAVVMTTKAAVATMHFAVNAGL